jgi:hypothetical protein
MASVAGSHAADAATRDGMACNGMSVHPDAASRESGGLIGRNKGQPAEVSGGESDERNNGDETAH